MEESRKLSSLVKKCDAELSIESRRILRWEAHCSSDCIELAWKPTQEFLERLAKQNPKFLLCFKSKPFSPHRDEDECVDVDIIGPDGKTAYLGMVVNIYQAITAWSRLANNCLDKAVICADALSKPRERELFDNYIDGLKKLIASGPLTIIRENIGCMIPVETEQLSRRAVEKGIKKIIAALMPSLTGIPIRWAPVKQQAEFERFVEQESKKRSKLQTDEECAEIFRQDVE